MKAYSIFDDFSTEAAAILDNAGVDLTIHPLGKPRPDSRQIKKILEDYDCVILGTSQKMNEDVFQNIDTPKIIASASVGLDHIKVPSEKAHLIKIINTPKASTQSVAEYTIGCALTCCKRLFEGNRIYREGRNNKALYRKPEDLLGKTIGVVGAGNISAQIMNYSHLMGMQVLCWTAHPESHRDLADRGIEFVSLSKLAKNSNIISVALPNKDGTKSIISSDIIDQMKSDTIFISVSRLATIDLDSLLCKAKAHPEFYVCLDIDVDEDVVRKIPVSDNIIVTPHIAGGTVETRKRYFLELAQQIADIVSK